MIDGIFYAQLGCGSVFEDTVKSRAVLDNVRSVIREGYEGRHLQRLPHITLLNKDFYKNRLRPALAEWACLWLLKQHLHGISGSEAVEYMLEGGAARSEASKKLLAIEGAIERRRTDGAVADSANGAALLHELELEQLDIAAAVAARQISAVLEVYNLEEQLSDTAQRRAERLATIELKLQALALVIKKLEFPRDTSLDNMVVVMLSSHFAETSDGNKPPETTDMTTVEVQQQMQQLSQQQQYIQQQMQQQSGSSHNPEQQAALLEQQQELQVHMQELQMQQQIQQQIQQQRMGQQQSRRGRKKKGNSAAVPPESKASSSASPVLDLCNALESLGYTVRRCYSSEDAINKARSLQLSKQLRCVITDSASRGPRPTDAAAAAAAAAETSCSYCGMQGHPAWSCPAMRLNQGQGAAATSDGTETFQGLSVVDFVCSADCGPVPKTRVSVIDDILKMGAAGRKKCWAEDIVVFSSLEDEAVEWVQSLQSWDEDTGSARGDERQTADPDAEFFSDDELADGEDGAPLSRQSSASTLRLRRLRARHDELDARKNEILAAGEVEAEKVQSVLAERSVTFHATVVEREADLLAALDSARADLAALDGKPIVASDSGEHEAEGQWLLATPSSGRDAALALAWLAHVKQQSSGGSVAALTSADDGDRGPSEELVEATDQGHLLQHFYRSAISWIAAELRSLGQMRLAAKVIANVSFGMQRLLNFAHDWLSTLLPHCLAKVNRVTFGLLTPSEASTALEKDPNMPRSRLMLAVPFLGKDVPSQSSEFAHPDVIVGLTILAYRHSGLRPSDFAIVMDGLVSDFEHEIGPPEERAASLRHAGWALHSGGIVRGLAGGGGGGGDGGAGHGSLAAHGLPEPDVAGQCDPNKRLEPSSGQWLEKSHFVAIYGGAKEWEEAAAEGIEIVQLKFLQQSNDEQMQNLYTLWERCPRVIHRYLSRSVFPEHMRSQRMKISASGQAVGGDMLFGRRVGFSGTPSDLLPKELGQCDYEQGDDGKMLSTVLDPAIMDCEKLGANWGVDGLLDRIAQIGGEDPDLRFHALIDPGALVTGYSNLQVAQQLLARGLTWCDGVVFLNDSDQQQVLVRATGRVVPADQCGVALATRFAFYDQIHTTGMDIKHVVNARAAITLGKDMVFRDYVQGAFRMRGIGRGQRITVFIIPEVEELMARQLSDRLLGEQPPPPVVAAAHMQQGERTMPPHRRTLEDIAGWLYLNSMASEQIQWQMLSIQVGKFAFPRRPFHTPHHQNLLY